MNSACDQTHGGGFGPLFDIPANGISRLRWELAQQYDQAHPDIWSEFEEQSLRAISLGVRRYSAKALFEVVRWHRHLENFRAGRVGDEFKVNNNFSWYFARKFMHKYREREPHNQFFNIRALKGKAG